MVIVFDSSPWIFLSKLGLIERAIGLFSEVFLSSSVGKEVLSRRDEASAELERLQLKGKVKVVSAKSSRLVRALGRRLGKGEAEAIALALEKDVDFVILDDHVARTEAMHLGLEVKGTLAIIRRLMEQGKLEMDLSELYRHLKEMGFWVKENIFWEIFSGIDLDRENNK
jgi:predicted nucleic acid-binding protein